MNIYKQLSNVQAELKAPKNQFNGFGKYNYRSFEDILEAVKPICAKHNLTLVVSDDLVQVGERYYVKAIATLFNEEGNTVQAKAFAREADNKKGMDESQLTGSTSSYARKYALNGLFNIDDTKDSDFTNKHGKDEKQEKKETKSLGNVTEDEATELAIKKGLATVLNKLKHEDNVEFKPTVMETMCERYNVDKWGDIRFTDYNKFINEVKEELDKQKNLKEIGI